MCEHAGLGQGLAGREGNTGNLADGVRATMVRLSVIRSIGTPSGLVDPAGIADDNRRAMRRHIGKDAKRRFRAVLEMDQPLRRIDFGDRVLGMNPYAFSLDHLPHIGGGLQPGRAVPKLSWLSGFLRPNLVDPRTMAAATIGLGTLILGSPS